MRRAALLCARTQPSLSPNCRSACAEGRPSPRTQAPHDSLEMFLLLLPPPPPLVAPPTETDPATVSASAVGTSRAPQPLRQRLRRGLILLMTWHSLTWFKLNKLAALGRLTDHFCLLFCSRASCLLATGSSLNGVAKRGAAVYVSCAFTWPAPPDSERLPRAMTHSKTCFAPLREASLSSNELRLRARGPTSSVCARSLAWNALAN